MVNENTMFAPQAGSPSAELASGIDAEVTVIEVDDVSILPDAPNILTMTDGDSFETVIYQEVDSVTNELKQVTRGVEGQAQSWSMGEEIRRNITARDMLDVQEKVEFLMDKFYFQTRHSSNVTTTTMLGKTTASSDVIVTTMLDESTVESENTEEVTTLS